MANVDGSWNTVTKSPMGDQQAVLTVASSGDSFTGSFVGGLIRKIVTECCLKNPRPCFCM